MQYALISDIHANLPALEAAEFVRVEYNVETAARAILGSELPHGFAEFLKSGGSAKS
jgi:hypothetical protein